jgi:hypothetical protein
MLMMRDHNVDDYAALADMDGTDVGVLTDDDRDCLNALGEYLVSGDGWSRFAIWLLHKHFEPAPAEVFVERTMIDQRQTYTSPVPRAAFSPAGLAATALRFHADDTTCLGLVGMEFARPADFGSATPFTAADQGVLTDLADILRNQGKVERFGVRLIRDRLELCDSEVLVETCDIGARTLRCEVIDRELVTARSVETTWQWEPIIEGSGPTPVMGCHRACHSLCEKDDYGHHHHEGHEPSHDG